MQFLQRILENIPGLRDTPEAKRVRIGEQRTQVTSAVQALLNREGKDSPSPAEPECRTRSKNLLDDLPDLGLRLRRVPKRREFPYHYYLYSTDGLIVDRTWQQFLRPYFPSHLPDPRPPLPSHLPPVFIGTRDELVAQFELHAELPASKNGLPMTAAEFVDQQYGLGAYAHESHEVKSLLS